MILGLNKDLERALKDKEKYRKKLKEVMATQDSRSKNDPREPAAAPAIPSIGINVSRAQGANGPPSPSNADLEGERHSPVDVSLAPYPITPPADQVFNAPSAVGALLNPSHIMPKSSEHALDNFDHEEEDRAVDAAKKESDISRDLAFTATLLPSRSLPSEPPRVPPPNPPVAPSVSVVEATPMVDQGIPKFPPPSAPPPRKPPPAPLHLRAEAKVTPISPEDESDSDYDSLLAVDDSPVAERRGRRRTREEDDKIREILAEKEAEARSLSKKSKKSSHKGSPTAPMPEPARGGMPLGQQVSTPGNMPASLAGVLSGDQLQPRTLAAPLVSPGLPASPRPGAFRSPMNSPPLSPRSLPTPSAPLSPRAPRQPIPFPPHSPFSNLSPADSAKTAGSKSIDRAKEAGGQQSPTSHGRIYTGFVTEEYPDLLLPPNAIPSIQVKVASSRMKPSRASMLSLTQLEEDPVFTLAIMSRSEHAELWRVEKDITSFGKLDQRMKQCATFTAKTPDRSLFSGHAPAKLDVRRVVLDQYLEELLDTPLDLPSALELCRYLSINTLPPHADDNASPSESAGEPAVQVKGPGGRLVKNGYLTKRGKNFGGWKARFFVLDGPQLRYFEAPGGAHLGTIKLQNAQIGKQSQQSDNSPANTSAKASNGDELDNEYRHAFLILEPKKKDSNSHVKHVLCAESDRERDEWVEALLGWMNYKDANEDDSPTSATAGSDRQGSVSSTLTNPKKKGHVQARAQEPRGRNSDNLIGISYDSTKQSDLPEGAPPRRGTASPEPEDRVVGPVHNNISGPRDPQLISDMSSWGGKSTLAIPGPSGEEKKQRKRSFFGFGTRARASPDEQDPLYASGSAPPAQNEPPRGPVRHVFGAMLGDAVKFNGPVDVNVPLPAVVYRCIQYLDVKNAILEEGIFRLSGSNIIIKQLRERFNTEGDVNLLTDDTYYDIHAVASLLKLYLRELPTTILTRELHMHFVSITEMQNKTEKLAAVAELVKRLPQANATLLKYLLAFLIKIINHADMNKMTVRNVGIVFSPTLNIPAPVFALLLQNYQPVFGIDPGEYELPMPIAEAEPPQQLPVDPQPRRPSLVGPGGSPHRQRLMEQTQQRSTPTPPPATAGGPRQNSYDAAYMNAQGNQGNQGNGSQASFRPAYESGFGISYDQAAMHAPMPKQQQQPGYDRPIYGYAYDTGHGENSLAAPSDDAYSSKAKRRGSAMFTMNLNNQGSRSHLGEEAYM